MPSDKANEMRHLSLIAYAIDPNTGEDVEIDYVDAIKARINPSKDDRVVLRGGILYLRPDNPQ